MKVTRATLDQVVQSPTVRRQLRARASLILPRAQREAAKSGNLNLTRELRIEEGVRPGTKAEGFARPYARVIAYLDEDQRKVDRRTSRLTPRAILRRAGR